MTVKQISEEEDISPTPEKSLFINFAQKDRPIAENVIAHLRATKVFKDHNIRDSNTSLAGDERDKAIQQQVGSSSAIIHLLSSDFQTEENCKKAFSISIEANKQIFPVMIRLYGWQHDDSLVTIYDQILPENEKDINCFSKEYERDRVITTTISRIYDKMGIKKLIKKPGSRRKLIYRMIAALLLMVPLLVCVAIWYDVLLFVGIIVIATLLTVFYLLSILKKPTDLSLYKTIKS